MCPDYGQALSELSRGEYSTVQSVPTLVEAVNAHDDGDARTIWSLIAPKHRMDCLLEYYTWFQGCADYEEVLLDCWANSRSRASQDDWRLLFSGADRSRLLASGTALPYRGPYTLYRGTSGHGADRWVDGLSWTDSPQIAIWFAWRGHAFGRSNPELWRIAVDEEEVLAYIDDRSEREYLLLLPPERSPEKVQVDFSKVDRRIVEESGSSLPTADRLAIEHSKAYKPTGWIE